MALRARVFLWVMGLAACSGPRVVPDPRVAVRPRTSDHDSALVVLHDATLCALTVRDPSGRVFDRREDNGKLVPSSVTRRVPGPYWQVQNSGQSSSLLTVLTFPPGRYEIVELATSDDWSEIHDKTTRYLAKTECDGGLTRQRVTLPFRIDEGRVTLLALPHGPANFDDLGRLRLAVEDPFVRARASSWYPSIERVVRDEHAGLLARQRQRRAGYDVYPDCDHHTAVVRSEGTPARWDHVTDEDADAVHHYRPGFPIRSVHATGFGAGCVRPWAYMLMLSDPAEIPQATTTIGEWLVEENVAGEIDLVLSGIPELL